MESRLTRFMLGDGVYFSFETEEDGGRGIPELVEEEAVGVGEDSLDTRGERFLPGVETPEGMLLPCRRCRSAIFSSRLSRSFWIVSDENFLLIVGRVV